ncbi:hypothetical protein L198_05824 [Cryptococcus wingfieldii CBS 7118]|uniref:Acid phosphatase n=1 Tax=Cryptococcus wingfieldii CBS 7118 TaxID=1295528 RepID=A0A1E3IWS6_9TREE|nr:hypothetical protein L198_05824 [Cryptococcus wingfieldii CBS 7118]ODN92151.1 hypothetical protein L198_05824 [Cryptococcus wingfieldii CBS 7118]
MLWQLLVLPLAVAAPSQTPFAPKHINPLKHLSAISPFFIPNQEPTPLPPTCEYTRISLLVRHTSIRGNDDEYEDTMEPFIEKIKAMDKNKMPSDGEWAFLRNWESPISEDVLEKVSQRGEDDSTFFGRRLSTQYAKLFPPREKSEKNKKKSKHTVPFKVWSASSERDIVTAKAWIKGAFPAEQAGPHGEGDGKQLQLVSVPNKAKDWDRSLTPHKACDAFEKQSSLEPARVWLKTYAPPIRERLSQIIPDVAVELVDDDILAMQMLCGYETISQGWSPFCNLFTDNEWLDGEYYFDVRFHYMMGYGNHLSPYLGAPWVKTAKHLLDGKDTGDGAGEPHGDEGEVEANKEKHKLPKPNLPPNATHTQLFHPSFTHRESPAFVATFLNLYNSTYAHPASLNPPLTYRPPKSERAWRTSHVVSFLGHVALERFHCGDGGDYVRAKVNGKQEKMGGCEDGLEGSCKWETFYKWVDERALRWSGWEEVCAKKD